MTTPRLPQLPALLALLAATGCAPAATTPPPPAAQTTSYTGSVIAVLDGDTIDLAETGSSAKRRVRLLGIDAPEIAHVKPAECGADSARRDLDHLLYRTQVTITTDPVAGPTDTYGRTLGYVQDSAGNDIAETLLRRGLVNAWHPVHSPAPTRFAHYQTLARQAQSQALGSWASCPHLGRSAS